MEKNWKRGSLLLAASLGMASFASAEGPYLKTQQKQQKPAVAMNPSANAMVVGGADLTLQGNYLYMVANQDQMSYAYDADCVSATNAKGGREYFMGNKASSGFKVALGAFFDHDQWSSQIKYQWINPTQKSHIGDEVATARADGDPRPLNASVWVGDITPKLKQAVGSVDSMWELNHQTIDWSLTRNFHVSEYLKLSPFAGLKGTWQSQKLKSTATDVAKGTDTTPTNTNTYYNNLDEFKVGGVGLMGGLDACWCLSKHWSIYTNVCGAAMWSSYYDSKHQSFQTNDGTTPPYVTPEFQVNEPESPNYQLNITDDNAEGSKKNLFSKSCRYAICPVLTTELGLKWETFFCDDTYHFKIAAGWEEQVYVNFARFINLPATDLTLHGLNLKVKFGF